jgi:hypothetical protein
LSGSGTAKLKAMNAPEDIPEMELSPIAAL